MPARFVKAFNVRNKNDVVVVAQANKMARTIWAILAHGRAYQKEYMSARPA
jgi:hypothetical protein